MRNDRRAKVCCRRTCKQGGERSIGFGRFSGVRYAFEAGFARVLACGRARFEWYQARTVALKQRVERSVGAREFKRRIATAPSRTVIRKLRLLGLLPRGHLAACRVPEPLRE